MDLDYLLGKMVESTRENISMTKSMAKVVSVGQMAKSMMDHGSMV
jgi:hypothetical protein